MITHVLNEINVLHAVLTFATANLTLLRPNCDNGGTPQQHWVITEVSFHGLVNAQFNIVSTRHTNTHCKDIKLIFEGEAQRLSWDTGSAFENKSPPTFFVRSKSCVVHHCGMFNKPRPLPLMKYTVFWALIFKFKVMIVPFQDI